MHDHRHWAYLPSIPPYTLTRSADTVPCERVNVSLVVRHRPIGDPSKVTEAAITAIVRDQKAYAFSSTESDCDITF